MNESCELELLFSEGAGTIANDTSGNWNNGTLVNGPSWAPEGIHGSAYRSNGINQYINVASGAGLYPATAITLEAWIYPKNIGSDQHIISTAGGGPAPWGHDYYLRIEANDVEFRINDDALRANEVLPDPDRWYHVAATYDKQAGERKLYVNGQLSASNGYASDIATGHTAVAVGVNARLVTEGGGWAPFEGDIDEARIWSRALSATEILAHYTGVDVFPHTPIRINSNADFDEAHGVTNWATGNGTAGNPWIIEGWDINGTGYGYCIFVGNTTQHFVIRNCPLHDPTRPAPYDTYVQNSSVSFYNANYGDVRNCTVSRSDYGINVFASRYMNIDDNDISNITKYGICVLGGGESVNSTSNWFADANWAAICYIASPRSTIAANGGAQGLKGFIYLANVHNMTVRDNNILRPQQYCLYVVSIQDSEFVNNTFDNSTQATSSSVFIDTVKRCRFEGNRIMNSWYGMYLSSSCNWNIIDNNTYGGNQYSIMGMSASNNTISENDFLNSSVEGIFLFSFCNYNLIRGNNIAGSVSNGIVIGSDSSWNSVCYNNITDNAGTGVYVYDTESQNNTVVGNVIENNNWGVMLSGPSYTDVHHNIIRGNVNQASNSGTGNEWDDGYPSGGNYWGDYSGADVMCGPSQNYPGSDGVGDTPYSFTGGQDQYPMMNIGMNVNAVQNLNTAEWFATIQGAIDDAQTSGGHTLRAYAGTYSESVNVTKLLTIIGSGAGNTTVDAGGTGSAFYVTSSSVSITGFTMTGSGAADEAGLRIWPGCMSGNFSDNSMVANGGYGIWMRNSHNNIFMRNNVSGNAQGGIRLQDSSWNTIGGCTISHNIGRGIYGYSWISYSTISGNDISWNSAEGVYMSSYCQRNVLSNNTLTRNSNRGIWLESSSSNCDIVDNTVTFNGLVGPTNGIQVSQSNNVLIARNNVSGNGLCGIHALSSSYTFIENNTCNDNVQDSGIYIYYASGTSYYNKVYGNTAAGNQFRNLHLANVDQTWVSHNTFADSQYGIDMSYCYQNKVDNNSFVDNFFGFSLWPGTYNDVLWNNFTLNDYGLRFVEWSQYNDVIGNDFTQNGRAVVFEGGGGTPGRNKFYWNAFSSSTIAHVADWVGITTNTWNAPFPIGGNYWDNWTAPNNFGGETTPQTSGSPDGFVDVAYPWTGGSVPDYWPFTQPDGMEHVGPVWNLNTGEQFMTIQAAINDADTLNGHTLRLFPGVYYENVVVHKELSIYGNGTDTIVDGSGNDDNDIFRVTSSNVTIYDMMVRNGGSVAGDCGIEFVSVSWCAAEDIAFDNMDWAGIRALSSTNITVRNATVTTSEYGIYLQWSTNCEVSASALTTCAQNAMLVQSSDGNTIQGNTISSTGGSAIWISSSDDNDIINNTAIGQMGIDLQSSEGNLIEGCHVTGNFQGIHAWQSSWNTIRDCEGQGGQSAILLESSSNINVSACNVYNSQYGIRLNTCTWCGLTNNTVLGGISGSAILLAYDSDHNNVTGNTLRYNNAGISLSSSDWNSLVNNSVRDCVSTGILISEASNNNTVVDSYIARNGVGISLSASRDNSIYHNRFVGNTAQASDDGSNANAWDDGYPSGGNIWSDYSGTDVKSGAMQDQPVCDGIGDTNYSIDTDSADRYPFCSSAGIDYVVIVDGPNGTDGESPSDVPVGFNFTVTVWAAGYNTTWGYVRDVFATWSVTNSLGASATITNASGYSTTFNSGPDDGLAILKAEYNGTSDQVNATVTFFQPDIVIDATGDNVYENPPTAAQQVHGWVAAGGFLSYDIQLQNDGNATDTILFVWDISALPTGWTATMVNEDTMTDITADLTDNGTWFVDMAPGETANLRLTITASTSAGVGDYATVGMGFFSTRSDTNDSFGVSAIVPGVDNIVLTDAPNGSPLANVNLNGQGTVTIYASSYNTTWGYIGCAYVDWTCSPALGTFNNANGPIAIFTAGWVAGWANITGTLGALNDSFAVHCIGDTTAPTVNAGPDRVTNAQFLQNATASDTQSGIASYVWSETSGPGTITFGSASSEDTNISASTDGVYVIRLNVTDGVGNWAWDEFTLTWDTTAPTVNAGADAVAKAQYTQAATTADALSGIENYTWTAVSGPGTVTFGSRWAEDTAISASLSGGYIILLNVTDHAGNWASDEFFLMWDTAPPTVDIGPDVLINSQFVTDVFTVDSDSGIANYTWFVVSGGAITFGSQWSKNTTISAGAEGAYVIRLTVIDAVGNSAFDDFNLTWDTTAPAIDAGPDVVANAEFYRDSTVSEPAGNILNWTWSVISGPGDVSFGPQWNIGTRIQASADGIYVIGLNVTDYAGNVAHDDFTLIWDTTAPLIDVSNAVNTTGIWYNVTDANLDIVYWLHGQSNVTDTAPYFINLAPSNNTGAPVPGWYNFTIWAWDLAGNSASETVTVFIPGHIPGTAIPGVISTTPADGATGISTSTTIVITFNASMDTASVQAAFGMTNITSNATVFAFSWNAGNTTLTVTISPGLDPETIYSVIIDSSATDENGTAMAGEYRFSFTTFVDTDNDGTSDDLDTDDDGDGVSDSEDAFPLDPTETIDTDDDGLGNNIDPDDDGDGVGDADDPEPLNPDVGPVDDEPAIGNFGWILIILIIGIIGGLGAYFMMSRHGSKPPKNDSEGGLDDDAEAGGGTPTGSGPQAKGNSPTHVGSGPRPSLSDLPKNSGDDAGVANPTVTPPPGNPPPVPSATSEVKKPGKGP